MPLATSGTFAPLRLRDFRLLLSGFAIGQMLMPLQFITQILWVQEYAPQDVWLILVATIAASRGLGALTFGLYGGALADRFDRRWLLVAAQSLLALVTVLVASMMALNPGSMVGFASLFEEPHTAAPYHCGFSQANSRLLQTGWQRLQHGNGIPSKYSQLRNSVLAGCSRHQSWFLYQREYRRYSRCGCHSVGDPASSNASDIGSGDDPRILCGRTVEPASSRERNRCTCYHQL